MARRGAARQGKGCNRQVIWETLSPASQGSGVSHSWHIRSSGSAPSLPSGPYPPVEFIKVNGSGEHQESGCDQLVTLPDRASEPPAGDDAGTFGADVIAALGLFGQVVDEGL
jgi:hypothetical protein